MLIVAMTGAAGLRACLALSCGAFGQGAVNIVAAMGYLDPAPVTVAPGQLITLFLGGSVQGNISATVQGIRAPILEIGAPETCSPSPCSSTTAITIQIPYEIGPSCIFTNPRCDLALVTELIVTVNGVASMPFNLIPQADRVHFLTSCDTLVPGGSGIAPTRGLPCAPLVTHADGSLVTATSPAAGGEMLVAHAVGLDLTNPAVCVAP